MFAQFYPQNILNTCRTTRELEDKNFEQYQRKQKMRLNYFYVRGRQKKK